MPPCGDGRGTPPVGLIDIPVTWLGLPDSGLREADLFDVLRPFLGHGRHVPRALARRPAPRPSGRRHRRPQGGRGWDRGLGLPDLDLALGGPSHDGVALGLAARHRLDEGERRRKQAAISAFASQLGPGPLGEPPYCRP